MSRHFNGSFEGKRGLAVEVRGGSVEGAIRLLGRKVKQEGLLRELRQRQAYEKPSTAKRRRKAEATARRLKAQSRQES
jgi:small subunit ribosomal protein S21